MVLPSLLNARKRVRCEPRSGIDFLWSRELWIGQLQCAGCPIEPGQLSRVGAKRVSLHRRGVRPRLRMLYVEV